MKVHSTTTTTISITPRQPQSRAMVRSFVSSFGLYEKIFMAAQQTKKFITIRKRLKAQAQAHNEMAMGPWLMAPPNPKLVCLPATVLHCPPTRPAEGTTWEWDVRLLL